MDTAKTELLDEIREFVDISFQDGSPEGASLAGSDATHMTGAFAAAALWRLAPGIMALHDRCSQNGALSEERAVTLVPGTTIFAVPTGKPGTIGLAVVRGAGEAAERHVTFVTHDAEGRLEAATAADWKPSMAPALTALPDRLPEEPRDLIALAAALAPYADARSKHDLTKIVAEINRGHGKPLAAFATATVRRSKREALLSGYCRSDRVFRYTEIMAPVLAAAPAPTEVVRTGHGSYHAGLALDLDGGWPGPVCQEALATCRGYAFSRAVAVSAEQLARNHDLMVEHGYVYGPGGKCLKYNDTDIRCFAIPTGDPRVAAMCHENIDLCADTRRFVLVLHRDDQGKVERLEGHPVVDPVEAFLYEAENDVSNLVWRSQNIEGYEGSHTGVQRLPLAEFARRLSIGAPLPPPDMWADLVTGAGAVPSDPGLSGYWHRIGINDAWVLNRIHNGEDTGIGCEDSDEFGDERFYEDHESLRQAQTQGPR